MLIIAGSLVGSSGAILPTSCARAMNRSFHLVIMGGFGAAEGAAAAAPATTVRSGSAEDASFLLATPSRWSSCRATGFGGARQHAVEGDGAKAHRRA